MAGSVLRAMSRMAEAIEPMKAGLDASVARENWKNAAGDAGNLSELHLTLGRIAKSIELAEQSVRYADQSGDAFTRMAMRTTLADALHHAGRPQRSEDLFREAEAMQKDGWPRLPLLTSVEGYQYCDLLLGQGRWEDVRHRAAQTLQLRTATNWLLQLGLDHLCLARAAILAAETGRAYETVRDRYPSGPGSARAG